MQRIVTGIAWAAVLLLFSAAAEAKPLTLRSADRIIDRAFAAELAGDYAGARAAVRQRVQAAELAEEEPARARLKRWLIGQAERKQAFARHGKTAQGYWHAFSTLKAGAGARAEILWQRALRDIPVLERDFAALSQVDLRFERVVGLPRQSDMQQRLRANLTQQGITCLSNAPRARYGVRINLDATDGVELMYRWKVTTEVSYLLRDRHSEQRVVGSFSRRRSVVRETQTAARAFSIRRAVDDLGRQLVFQIRQDVLRDLAQP